MSGEIMELFRDINLPSTGVVVDKEIIAGKKLVKNDPDMKLWI
jgi:hypothetical protein